MAMIRWDEMTWDQKYAWYDANQPKPWNPKSNRAIRFKSYNRTPDSKLTKGYVKQAKKDKRNYGGLSLRGMQKASHKLQRLEDKREIELGLQDHEEQQKYTCFIDFAEEGEDFTGIYFYELDDCEDEQPSKFRKPIMIILDDLMPKWEAPPRWYYTHEGD